MLKNRKTPSKHNYIPPLLWTGIFGGLFVLSLDYWAWDEAVQLSYGGFPSWLFYFVILQILLVFALALFARFFWKK